MGLDMYLNKKTYVGANYEHNKVSGTLSLRKNGNKLNINLSRVTNVEEQVGYWRKANHIHMWMVNNIQDGEDDCKEYQIYEEQIGYLLATCKQVKEDHSLAESLLPTGSGFFFGSTDYDEGYYQDVDYTIEVLEQALKEIEEDKATGNYSPEYYYQSSW